MNKTLINELGKQGDGQMKAPHTNTNLHVMTKT